MKSLKLNNFLSHKETEISFTKEEKILIDGKSGTGKSSIVDAIVWCLYGVGRVDNRSLVRRGARKAKVELVLMPDDGKEETIIRRTISSKGKHTLSVSFNKGKGEVESELTGVKEIQKWIEKELIGASYLLFVNSIVHTQDGGELFVTQNAQKRKELLLEIVKAEDYDEYYEKAKKKITEFETDIATKKTSILEIKAFIDSLKERIARKETIGGELSEYKKKKEEEEQELKQTEEQLESFRDEIAKKKELEMLLSSNKVNIGTIKTEISECEHAQRMLDSIGDIGEKIKKIDEDTEHLYHKIREQEAEKEKQINKKTTYNEYFATKPEYNELMFDTQLDMLNKQLKEDSNIKTCPSGNNCPYVKKKTENIISIAENITKIEKEKKEALDVYTKWLNGLNDLQEPNEEEINKIDKAIGTFYDDITNLTTQKSTLLTQKADADTFKVKVEKLPELKKDLQNTENEVNDIVNKIKEIDKKVDDTQIEGIKRAIDNLRSSISNITSQIANKETILNTIKEDEEKIKKETERVEKTTKEIKGIEEKTEKLKLVKVAFGSNGIRSVVIDYMLPQLEDNINEILSKLSDFTVRLDTQSEKASGDGMKEGLFITIINDTGEELPYEAYSGGEKLKITVAISEALAKLQNVGFRMFDETVVALDDSSLQSFMLILERLSRDVKQTVCISHIRDVKDMFDNSVTCVKKNGITNINKSN